MSTSFTAVSGGRAPSRRSSWKKRMKPCSDSPMWSCTAPLGRGKSRSEMALMLRSVSATRRGAVLLPTTRGMMQTRLGVCPAASASDSSEQNVTPLCSKSANT
nr:MAG: hypothetical protein [Molluscum contagiosum virus]